MQLVQEGPKQQGKTGFDTERGAKFYRFKVHQHTGDGDGDNYCDCDDDYYHHHCYVDDDGDDDDCKALQTFPALNCTSAHLHSNRR